MLGKRKSFGVIAACFPTLLAPNRPREIGGGRATRQSGQVRKEAALTRSGSGRSSVSYLFFRANPASCPMQDQRFRPNGLCPAKIANVVPQARFERQHIAD